MKEGTEIVTRINVFSDEYSPMKRGLNHCVNRLWLKIAEQMKRELWFCHQSE
jgi:hypothetical protein